MKSKFFSTILILGILFNVNFSNSVASHDSLPDLTNEVAQKIVEQAHAVCPYSNATRGNLDVQITIE